MGFVGWWHCDCVMEHWMLKEVGVCEGDSSPMVEVEVGSVHGGIACGVILVVDVGSVI